MPTTPSPAHAPGGADPELLSIGEVEARTGLTSSTLRSWERRVGFPVPVRTAGGQRRYLLRDAERVTRVLAERERGLNLGAAVEAVLRADEVGSGSLYAELRTTHPHLDPIRASLRVMRNLSWAIEDECLAHASRPLLFGGFQTEASFRTAGRRWRELARSASAAVVLSDFPTSDPHSSPVEVALDADSPMLNEWSLICHDPKLSVALIAWEIPRSGREPAPRRFEAVLTLEPGVVHDAARAFAAAAAAAGGPDLAPVVAARATAAQEDPRRSASLLRRFAAYADA